MKRVTRSMSKKQLILFDGVCQFCDNSVKFIIKRDLDNRFVFASIQSTLGHALMEHHNLFDEPDTFVLIDGDICLTMSDAVLEVVKQLSGLWRMFSVLEWVPKKMRDDAYSLFGRYRYKVFGQFESCTVPSEQLKAKFVGQLTLQEWEQCQ